MSAVTELAPSVGIVAACDCLAVARASYYRRKPRPGPVPEPDPAVVVRPTPARALHPEERAQVLAVLHEERFQDRSPLRSRPPCWMKAAICARPAPCIES
jgi:putative transposase